MLQSSTTSLRIHASKIAKAKPQHGNSGAAGLARGVHGDRVAHLDDGPGVQARREDLVGRPVVASRITPLAAGTSSPSAAGTCSQPYMPRFGKLAEGRRGLSTASFSTKDLPCEELSPAFRRRPLIMRK